MTNPRERTKKSSGEVEVQDESPLEEVPTVAEVVEETTVEAEERAKSPLDEVMSQAEKAYAAYMEAERQVARAYH